MKDSKGKPQNKKPKEQIDIAQSLLDDLIELEVSTDDQDVPQILFEKNPQKSPFDIDGALNEESQIVGLELDLSSEEEKLAKNKNAAKNKDIGKNKNEVKSENIAQNENLFEYEIQTNDSENSIDNSIDRSIEEMIQQSPPPPQPPPIAAVTVAHDPFDDSTKRLDTQQATKASMTEATVAIGGLQFSRSNTVQPEAKISLGQHKGVKISGGQVFTSADASLIQAENLKIAQERILSLEKELEKLRSENDEVSAAGDVIRQKYEDLNALNHRITKDQDEVRNGYKIELELIKNNLEFKDKELQKAKVKSEEYEIRLKQDFKKIRIRERELENRIELLKAEQVALLRTKDDFILDLKRKIDVLESEIETYRNKVFEYNKTFEDIKINSKEHCVL